MSLTDSKGQSIPGPASVSGCAFVQVLDVGSGSGYLSAVFAHLVCSASGKQPSGDVIGVDHIPELVDLAKRNLQSSPFTTQRMEERKLQIVEVCLAPDVIP